MLMPGMLTAEQMKQLDAARGPEFDRLFLTFMIQHHRGAVAMVEKLFHSYGAGQDEMVFKFGIRHERRSDHRDRPDAADVGQMYSRSRRPALSCPVFRARSLHFIPT